MATVKVYRFAFYDPLLKHDRMSVDYATAEAIAAKHGTIFSETQRLVDEALLDDEGVVRAIDIGAPLPEEAPWARVSRSRTAGGAVRRG